jgi:uncharacterized protein (DUF697 family)
MANLIEIYDAAKKAIAAYQKINTLTADVLPEDIEKIVLRHARIAVATGFIPVGGLDVAAATANIWAMYISINKAIGIKFSENIMKSVGSAVVANLVQNLGVIAIAEALRWNPIAYPISVAIMSSVLYALTIVSGWVYLKSLTNMAENDDDIDRSVRQTLSKYSDVRTIFNKYRKK